MLKTAAQPTLQATHRVAAWNAICALLDRCTQHDNELIRDVLFRSQWWSRCFGLYLTQAQMARPKSGRQLLVSLASALRRVRDDDVDFSTALKDAALRALLDGLLKECDPGRAKTCAQALGLLLSKDIVTLDEVLEQMTKSKCSRPTALGSTEEAATLQSLLVGLFQWIAAGDFGSIIGQLASAILDRVPDPESNASDSAYTVPWAAPLRHVATEASLEPATLRTHLLPTLLKRDPVQSIRFIQESGLNEVLSPANISGGLSNAGMDLLSACLQTGKDLNIVREMDCQVFVVEDRSLYIPVPVIGRWLRLANRNIRLTALYLLVASPASTRPLLQSSFEILQANLDHLFSDTDANFRGEVCGLIQLLIDRVRAATAALTRPAKTEVEASQPSGSSSAVHMLEEHKNFVSWLNRSLAWQLRPTASYQRHISALRCLYALARSGLDPCVSSAQLSKSAMAGTQWPFTMPILTGDLRRILLDMAIDPFDDVRQAAIAVLRLYPTEDAQCIKDVKAMLHRAETAMLATGRADQADGVAHLYALLHHLGNDKVCLINTQLQRLQQMLSVAKDDLPMAVQRYPVHGILTSLRYLLDQVTSVVDEDTGMLDRIAGLLKDVWAVVKPVLCDDAPEGYLPEDQVDTQAVSTKDTLSYCWRALKEASLLLGVIVRLWSSKDASVTSRLSDLCFEQLAELRHRGAFSTVAQTWVLCCLASGSKGASINESALNDWYQRVITILRNRTIINTRRSAGLPSLLCGVLVADANGPLTARAVSELDAIAREPVEPCLAHEGSLPQVHAVNCMKDVLKHSRLSDTSEPYIPLALRLAAAALQSQAWAIRNCGLMLFRAVIDRLLGTSDTHLDDDGEEHRHTVAVKDPQVIDIVLSLLTQSISATDSEGSTTTSPGVFPALKLLERLTLPSAKEAAARASVRRLIASPVWHVRDKAARTYASLTPLDSVAAEVVAFLRTGTGDQNALHGALLCCKYLLSSSRDSRLQRANGEHGSLLQDSNLVQLMEELCHRNPCPVTKAGFLDVYITLYIRGIDLDTGTVGAVDFFGPSKDYSFPADAVLRRTHAELLAALLLHEGGSADSMLLDIHRQVQVLAHQDADACTAFCMRTKSLLDHAALSNALRDALSSLAATIVRNLDAHAGLRCAAAQLLLHIRHVKPSASQPDEIEALRQEPSFTALVHKGNTNEHLADLCLELEAAALQASLTEEINDGSLFGDRIKALCRSCRDAYDETSVYSREASVHALARLESLWQRLAKRKDHSAVFMDFCLLLYDQLKDDDEDLRDVASGAAARLFAMSKEGAPSALSVPAAASQDLISFMIMHWTNSPFFADVVVGRAFGNIALSFAERLEASVRTDTSLFMQEKQNLYIDEADEALAWAEVGLRLPSISYSETTISRLAEWTSNGLDALLAPMDDVASQPIRGLTPELFTLILQLMSSAQLLLELSADEQGSALIRTDLRTRLDRLMGDEDAMHPLIRRHIEQTLAKRVRPYVLE